MFDPCRTGLTSEFKEGRMIRGAGKRTIAIWPHWRRHAPRGDLYALKAIASNVIVLSATIAIRIHQPRNSPNSELHTEKPQIVIALYATIERWRELRCTLFSKYSTELWNDFLGRKTGGSRGRLSLGVGRERFYCTHIISNIISLTGFSLWKTYF